MTLKEMLEEFFKTHSFQDFPELVQALATLEVAEAIRALRIGNGYYLSTLEVKDK